MKTVNVNTSHSYNVFIGNGILHSIGEYALEVGNASKVAIISDSHVWPLYGHIVANSMASAGFEVISYVFPAGEDSKNGHTYLNILDFLAQNTLTRTDLLIALGGGVVGDITGFAAATYLRGISYIQVPTSLLAMVDSSVGGKTAIDLPSGKNLAGAFYQPDLVLCDIETLSSLPMDIFQDGCAEVIKYGILYDPTLYNHLETHGLQFDREYVISCCVEWKRDVVRADEFDRGARQMLNLGHTFAHGIEANSNYTVSHGRAVAIGMAMASRAAAKYGICQNQVAEKICALLTKFGLPVLTDYAPDRLARSALSDKKRTGQTINMIVPETIGHCMIHSIPIEEVKSFIEAGI